MGQRREPRSPMQVRVRIFGTDIQGQIFSENVTTVDVSHYGVKLSGIQAKLRVDEIVGLTYAKNKAHFRVRWLGVAGTPAEGRAGLINLTPDRPLWDFPLPYAAMDDFRPGPSGDRRKSRRIKCAISVEIRPNGQPMMYGKASDLSIGGCFVEMPIPLARDAPFEIALWLGDSKLRLQASVASSAPGYGIGVRFLDVSEASREQLDGFICNLVPVG